MGFVPRNLGRTYINGVIDLSPLIVTGYYVTNLSYLLADKGNNSIFFT